jgi:magnesium transporter
MEQAVLTSTDQTEFAEWLDLNDTHVIAGELNRSTRDARIYSFRHMPKDKAIRVMALLEPVNQRDILMALGTGDRKDVLEGMEPDDRGRLFSQLPREQRTRLLEELSAEERRLTLEVLRHPEHSAGRIMTPEFVRLVPEMSAGEALEAVRSGAGRAETVYLMPVAGEDMRLLGMVDLAEIALAAQDARIADLMTKEVPAVSASDDQEDVARLMKSADLLVVPVVEGEGRLVGVVTFDDAMEVLEFEEGEDFARTGGAEPIARPYLSVPITRLVRSRVIWLSVLAVAATLTVNVLNAFEETLDNVVSLALFIPLLIGIGGNTGAQSATTVVRALAVGDIRPGDVVKVALRETGTGLLMGSLIAVLAYAVVAVIFESDIALIVALTLVAICTLAALAGSLMPIAARVLSVDPAVVSAPFVTVTVDASGLLIYFLIAQTVLGL